MGKFKELAVGFVILLVLIGFWSFNTSKTDVEESKETTQQTVTQEVNTDVSLGDVTYEIVSVDDSSTPQAVRHTLNVVVVGSEVTEAKLFKIAKLESLLYTSSNDVNALSVGFYSSAENIGQGYDYGSVDYAPEGDWSKASEVVTGDYSTFEFDNNLY
ncbi:MAG: hypothetical protein ACRDCC_06325 [Culicoidibacterales bacterium]